MCVRASLHGLSNILHKLATAELAREVIAAGGVNAIRSGLQSKDSDTHLLAARCLADLTRFTDARDALAQGGVAGMLRNLLEQEVNKRSAPSSPAAAPGKETAYAPVLTVASADSGDKFVLHAVNALANLGASSAVTSHAVAPGLLRVLGSQENESSKLVAAQALAQMLSAHADVAESVLDGNSIDELCEVLRSERSSSKMKCAAAALLRYV